MSRPDRFEVQTNLAGTWENIWQDTNDSGICCPTIFFSAEEAHEEIVDHLQDVDLAVEQGDMIGGYSEDDFRIVNLRTNEVVVYPPKPEPAPQATVASIDADLVAAVQRLINSADDAGCCDDLTVVSKHAVEDLEECLDAYNDQHN